MFRPSGLEYAAFFNKSEGSTATEVTKKSKVVQAGTRRSLVGIYRYIWSVSLRLSFCGCFSSSGPSNGVIKPQGRSALLAGWARGLPQSACSVQVVSKRPCQYSLSGSVLVLEKTTAPWEPVSQSWRLGWMKGLLLLGLTAGGRWTGVTAVRQKGLEVGTGVWY